MSWHKLGRGRFYKCPRGADRHCPICADAKDADDLCQCSGCEMLREWFESDVFKDKIKRDPAIVGAVLALWNFIKDFGRQVVELEQIKIEEIDERTFLRDREPVANRVLEHDSQLDLIRADINALKRPELPREWPAEFLALGRRVDEAVERIGDFDAFRAEWNTQRDLYGRTIRDLLAELEAERAERKRIEERWRELMERGR